MFDDTPEKTDKDSFLPIDISIQYHILRMMVINENFLTKASSFLNANYFENSTIQWFFEIISKHYDKYKKKIEFITLHNEILKFDPRDRVKYEIILEKIENSNYTDELYVRNELTGWVKSREFRNLHKNVAELFNSDQKEKAYDFTNYAINRLNQIDFNEDKIINFRDIESIIQKVSNVADNNIPLGIPLLDDAMLGGLSKGLLTTILGSTNAGKTITLINIAYNAIKAGKKVLFIYHEGHDDQMTLRFLSRFTEIPYMRFYQGFSSFDDRDKEKISNAKYQIDANLILKPWQMHGTTVEEVISYAKHKINDFNFDMIIVDYAQLLYTKYASKEVRHNQAIVYRALGGLAAELNAAVVTAAQGTRDSHNKTEKGEKLLGLTDISECFEIIRCSPTVLTLTRSLQDTINNKIKILLAKQKDGKVNLAVECNTDIDRIIVYDKSCGIYPFSLSQSDVIQNERSTQLQCLS